MRCPTTLVKSLFDRCCFSLSAAVGTIELRGHCSWPMVDRDFAVAVRGLVQWTGEVACRPAGREPRPGVPAPYYGTMGGLRTGLGGCRRRDEPRRLNTPARSTGAAATPVSQTSPNAAVGGHQVPS